MTQLQTRREYLIGLGLAKPGRGKFSKAANEALAKARAEGIVFSDDDKPVSTPRATPVGGTSEPRAAVVPVTESPYLYPSDFRFPEDEYRAVAVIDGKRTVFGMRECCNNCRVSLTNHVCDAPSIYGNVSVTVERKVSA